MRTIIELPDRQLQSLEAVCRRDRISRAEAIRRAIAAYVRSVHAADAGGAYGLWRDRGLDGLTYERELRTEWDGRDRRLW